MQVLISGVVGLTAAGLHCEHSTVDRARVVADDPGVGFDINDLGGITRTYGLADFLKKAAACDPDALELLWLPRQCYQQVGMAGEELIRVRDSFLHAEGVRDRFLAAATGLMRELEHIRRAPEDKSGPPRSYRLCSTARELAMIMHRGTALYRTGQMVLRLPEPAAQRCRDSAQQLLRRSCWDLDPQRHMLARFAADLQMPGSPLPRGSACLATSSR